MERSKNWLILLFVFVITEVVASDYADRIYNAFIRGDMVLWRNTMLELEQKKDKTIPLWEELISYQYGYIGYCIGVGQHQEAGIYVDKMDKILKNTRILQHGLRESYRSAWYGFKIGLNKVKAPFLGPKSIELSKKAMNEYPDCYLGYVQMGNYLLHTPALFGGDKAQALLYFNKGLRLLAAKQPSRNWDYLNLLTLVARAKYESGDQKGAIQLLTKILQIEPKFSWVSQEILPAYKKGVKPNYIRNLEKYGYNE